MGGYVLGCGSIWSCVWPGEVVLCVVFGRVGLFLSVSMVGCGWYCPCMWSGVVVIVRSVVGCGCACPCLWSGVVAFARVNRRARRCLYVSVVGAVFV